MKRAFCAALAVLVLLACSPALAAEAAVRPLGTSGEVTVGVRGRQLVYTTDGLNWKNGSLSGEDPEMLRWGFWNGTEFLAFSGQMEIHPTVRSKDGVSWTRVPEDTKEDFVYLPRGRVEVGRYRFELDSGGELWLIEKGVYSTGMQLPDVGEAGREREVCFTDIQAYPVPGGVRLEAFSLYSTEEPYVTVYPTSSLDWVLKNQGRVSNGMMEVSRTDNGKVFLTKMQIGQSGACILYADTEGGAGSTVPNAPWNENTVWGPQLLPYNGKTFLVLDSFSLRLYASEDGVHWDSLEDTFLAVDAEQEARYDRPTMYSQHKLLWTGSEYIACRRTAQDIYGMMGSGGGNWHSGYCTKVCFADGQFQLTGSYDFGRQVLRVGYANGVYYAEVSDRPELNDRDTFDKGEIVWTSTIYRSTDKQNWTPTDLGQVFASLYSVG